MTRVLTALILMVACTLPNLASAQLKWLIAPIYYPRSVAYSPNCQLVAVGGSGGAAIYSISTGVPKYLQDDAMVQASNVTFSPNGRILAVCGVDANNRGIIDLWSTANATRFGSINISTFGSPTLAFSPSGSVVAIGGHTSSYENFLELWDVASLRRVKSLATQGASSQLQFSHVGTL